MQRSASRRGDHPLRAVPKLLLGLAWVVLLGISLLSPLHPQGPFDARTGEPVAAARLRMPASTVALELLAAPAHILAGSPDYRAAGAATLLWVCATAALVAWRRQRRVAHRRAGAVATLSIATGLSAGLLLLLWVAFVVFVRIPGWQLEVDDPTLAIADLQSHTYGSHDGVISARDNLLTHGRHGFDVVAITEHQHPAGAFAAQRAAHALGPKAPEVLAGIELRSPLRAFLLGIGLREDRPAPQRVRQLDAVFEPSFIDTVHRLHGGAVLVLGYRLRPDDARRLADLGVDGFEISNFGHPDLPPPVRETLLELWRTRGVVLVASSDWHGWSGLFRTWTLVRLPSGSGAEGTPGAGPQVIDLLRAHRAEAFIPVVAGHIAAPGPWRIAFAPFVETARYLLELSPRRVVAWGFWGLCVWLLAGAVSRTGRRPGWALLAILLAVFAAGFGYRGADWLLAWASGNTHGAFAAEVGGGALGGAALCVMTAWGALRWSKPRGFREPTGD